MASFVKRQDISGTKESFCHDLLSDFQLSPDLYVGIITLRHSFLVLPRNYLINLIIYLFMI